MRDGPLDDVTAEGRSGADEIRIANAATYWPIAPTDVVLAIPLAARLLLGATPLGRVVQAAVFGAYAASALQDWAARRGVRKIDFRREFGADVRQLTPMPREAREQDVTLLTERLNDEFTADRIPRRELAVEVDRYLTDYIAGVTGQRVDECMRLTGQNGLSDYDVGFTNFLYTFELNTTARQEPPAAGTLRSAIR